MVGFITVDNAIQLNKVWQKLNDLETEAIAQWEHRCFAQARQQGSVQRHSMSIQVEEQSVQVNLAHGQIND